MDGYLDNGMKLPVLIGLGAISLSVAWIGFYFLLCL
jgi:hypothetical protein